MSCESKSALRTDSGASDVAQLARENDHTEAAEWASTHASSTPLFARDGSDGAHLTTEEEVPRVAQSAASFYSTYVNPLRPCPPAWNWPAPCPPSTLLSLPDGSDDARLAADAGGDASASITPLPILTLAQLQSHANTQGMGGKTACQKQRELRTSCFAQGIFEVDLSNSDWPWQSLLRALPAQVGANIVGPGVVAFKFRLLEGVRDHNYARVDTGEKHVFEVLRVDGSACHLHFHKNGKMDAPTFHNTCGVLPPAGHGLLPPANRGVLPPAESRAAGDAPPVYKSENNLVHETYAVGKNEARAACARLLDAYPGAQSIDITDEVGFAWKRFLKTQTAGRDITGPGIDQACVVQCPGGPSLAFSRTDGLLCLVTPSKMRSVPPYRMIRRSDAPEYDPHHRATESWMRCGPERGMSTSSQ